GLGEIRVRGRIDLVEVGLGQTVGSGIQFRDFRTVAALQGVEVGDARTQRAVGGDDGLDIDLLAGDRQGLVGSLRGTDLEGVFACALGEGGDDRGMGLVARGFTAIDGRLVLQLIEIGAPLVWNGTRVVQVGFVEVFYIGRIG